MDSSDIFYLVGWGILCFGGAISGSRILSRNKHLGFPAIGLMIFGLSVIWGSLLLRMESGSASRKVLENGVLNPVTVMGGIGLIFLAILFGVVFVVTRIRKFSDSPEGRSSGVWAPAVRYGDLLGRFNVVEREFAAVETDPEFLLSHPAIRDVTVPATAAFHRARRVAAEVVDVASVSLEATASEGDIEAIDALEKAWEDAMRVAEAMVENGISVAMRSRAQRLLDRIVAPANEHELEADKRALAAILDNITYTDSSTGAIKRLNGTAIITHIPQHALAGAKLQEISSSCEK